MKRRSFVKGTLSAGATSLAVGAGLLSPAMLLAEDTKPAEPAADAPKADAAAIDAKADAEKGSGFDMSTVDSAEESADIKIKAPEVAENGAVVPVSVTAGIDGATAITLVAPKNPDPLVGTFHLGEGTEAYASTRIKMGKSGSVVALVTAGDKTFKASTDVKVTIGGCGG